MEAKEVIEAFSSLFYLFAKYNVQEARLDEIADDAGFNPDFKPAIFNMYENNKQTLRSFISKNTTKDEIRFKELRWRIDMEIADKIKGSTLVPKFLLNLILKENEREKSMLIESNYANLEKMKNELKNAVSAINLSYGRKVIKYAK